MINDGSENKDIQTKSTFSQCFDSETLIHYIVECPRMPIL